MKTINLFLKAHFTSLSPDGQFISLAIVSDDSAYDKPVIKNDSIEEFVDHIKEKSFYCEFSDFDINRCDDWVKENVISKLKYLKDKEYTEERKSCQSWNCFGNTNHINLVLNEFFKQFSDYKINFVVDCGWFYWGKFVELMGKWDIQKENITSMLANPVYDSPLKAHAKDVIIYQKCAGRDMFTETDKDGINLYIANKVGLPKLPANFPPVPQDLNDLIALRRGISVSEAFELDRESLAYDKEKWNIDYAYMDKYSGSKTKFNALFDAKVTKSIYEKFI